MGINDINEVKLSLLTQRLERYKRVERREGEDDSGKNSHAFEEILNRQTEEKKEEEGEKQANEYPKAVAPPTLVSQARSVLEQDREEKPKKIDLDQPGILIDVEA